MGKLDNLVEKLEGSWLYFTRPENKEELSKLLSEITIAEKKL